MRAQMSINYAESQECLKENNLWATHLERKCLCLSKNMEPTFSDHDRQERLNRKRADGLISAFLRPQPTVEAVRIQSGQGGRGTPGENAAAGVAALSMLMTVPVELAASCTLGCWGPATTGQDTAIFAILARLLDLRLSFPPSSFPSS